MSATINMGNKRRIIHVDMHQMGISHAAADLSNERSIDEPLWKELELQFEPWPDE